MATTLGLTAVASVNGSFTSARDLGIVNYPIGAGIRQVFTNGVIANTVNMIFDDERTIALSSSENLDLFGSLTDAYGTTLNFVKVNLIYVEANAANTNNVVLGAHATAPFLGPWNAAGTTSLPPGASVLLTCPNLAGWAVTPTTGDMIKVLNSGAGTSVTYKIIIAGRDA